MHLMDSDTISELLRNPGQHNGLERRVREAKPGTIMVSVVTVAELMQGTLAFVRRLEKTDQEDRGYALLEKAFYALQRFPVASYDSEAHALFLTFSPAVRRQGRGDCQIAATALRHGYVVITRNLRHFQAIPDVQCEDWTAPR